MQMEGLDAIDNKILDAIKDHARLTYKEIGERVGISRVSVKTRMEAMQERGIIKGYQTVIDVSKAVDGIRFFLDIECTPDYYEEMAEYLASNKMIRQIYGVSGESRIHAVGLASNTRNLELFANRIYRSQRGVRRLSCHTVLSTIKDVDGGVEYVRYQEHGDLEEETGEQPQERRNNGHGGDGA